MELDQDLEGRGQVEELESQKSKEEPEGFDDYDDSLSEYQLENLNIRPEPRTLRDLKWRLDEGNLVLNPDFQRDFIWTSQQQSRLVESCLMRIPIPVFYFAEDEIGRLVVVDGLQRLTTLFKFMNDKFSLKIYSKDKQVQKEHPFHNLKYSDLKPLQKTRMNDTQIMAYVIESSVPEAAKLDIFERVNGGSPLTRQQMRHALYQGKGTKFLGKAAEEDWFIKATTESLKANTMRDREVINRFAAFKLIGWQEKVFSGSTSTDVLMGNALRKMNNMTDDGLEKLMASFLRSMENNVVIFGDQAFRKPSRTEGRRSIFNVGLFDVFSVLMSEYATDKVQMKKVEVLAGFQLLLEDKDFFEYISRSTNTPGRVRARFEMAKNMLEKVFS